MSATDYDRTSQARGATVASSRAAGGSRHRAPADDAAHWDAIAALATPPALDVDETIHHYHRAAGELWKFCFSRGGGSHAEFMAGLLKDMAAGAETIDWWERAAPRRRP